MSIRQNFVIVLAMLLGLVSSSNASEVFVVTAEIARNNQIIGSPKLLLPESEEGTIESIGKNAYALTATVTNDKEGNVSIKTKLSLSNNNYPVSVGEPVFILKKGEWGSIEIDHPVLGKVELKIKSSAQSHS